MRQRGIALILVLFGLFAADRLLAPESGKRSEYGLLLSQAKRLKTKGNASVLVLGQSTTGNWLTPRTLGRVLRVSPRKILDGHLSGCHPDCSYAEVRKLLSQGRHFEQAYFGVNAYTLCEGEPRRRVAAELLTLPLEDTFLMARHYLDARKPTTYLGAMAALYVSHAYRDPEHVQRLLLPWIHPKPKPESWMKTHGRAATVKVAAEAEGRSVSRRGCSLEPRDVAFKVGVLRSLLADLGKLSDRTYVMALPDRTLTERATDPVYAERWSKFTQLLEELTRAQPGLTFLDMATHGPTRKSHYRDAIHLSQSGLRYQTRALKRLLRRRRR